MKKAVLFAMGLVMSISAHAQDTDERLPAGEPASATEALQTGPRREAVKATISGTLLSRYIWRGCHISDVSIQPSLSIDYHGLNFLAEGSVGIESADTKELDLTLSYTTGGLSFGISDYWSDDVQDTDEYGEPRARYFLYDSHRTNHTFEAFIGYDFGLLSATCYTNFAGSDGVNKNGNRAYSTYIELVAPFRLATCDWTATLGIVPHRTTAYETTGFAITNVALRATKDIAVTKSFSIPVFVEMIGNPCLQKAYVVLGGSLVLSK